MALLKRAAAEGELLICEVVYAEVGAHFTDELLLGRFLRDTQISVERSELACLAVAGRKWRQHRKNSPGPCCPQCGASVTVECPQCARAVNFRQHLIPDFLVASHAVSHANRLLSRDRGFYARYFPDLMVIRDPRSWV